MSCSDSILRNLNRVLQFKIISSVIIGESYYIMLLKTLKKLYFNLETREK